MGISIRICRYQAFQALKTNLYSISQRFRKLSIRGGPCSETISRNAGWRRPLFFLLPYLQRLDFSSPNALIMDMSSMSASDILLKKSLLADGARPYLTWHIRLFEEWSDKLSSFSEIAERH